jgi:tetratricopeptide (TPR) repeat protein
MPQASQLKLGSFVLLLDLLSALYGFLKRERAGFFWGRCWGGGGVHSKDSSLQKYIFHKSIFLVYTRACGRARARARNPKGALRVFHDVEYVRFAILAKKRQNTRMAIFHASMKAIQRSTGRSSVAAAAYRAGDVLIDESTGCVHDYPRKRGVEHRQIVMPGGQIVDRGEFWSRVEKHHKRKDATTARELEVGLPCELPLAEKKKLAVAMAKALSAEYGVAADVCIHAPSGDERNWHAHILMTACAVKEDGSFGNKVEALDPIHCARRKLPTAADWVRPMWEKLANEALERAGKEARIDHRSHAERGLAEVPSSHLGQAAAGLVTRGKHSFVAEQVANQAALKAAALLARQVLDAAAAEALLAAQAKQAQAELEAELEAQALAEQAQAAQEAAEAAEREAKARAQAEAAERARAAAEAAQRAAEAQAAEQAVQAAAERARVAAEAQAQRQAAERLQAAQNAERALAERDAAQRAVDAAERKRQALWPAYDAAIVGQRQAGESLLATARAIPKISGWQRAIDAYEQALGVLAKAQAVLQRAGRALAAAMSRLEMVDPAVREVREARERSNRQAYEAQQRRIAEASAAAAAQAAAGRQRGRVTVHHQGPHHQDDQERGPDVPRM